MCDENEASGLTLAQAGQAYKLASIEKRKLEKEQETLKLRLAQVEELLRAASVRVTQAASTLQFTALRASSLQDK